MADLWLAAGDQNAVDSKVLASSPDGDTWSRVSTPFDGGKATAAAWSGSLWVLTGIDSGALTCVATSPDGSTWTARSCPFAGVGGGAAPNCVAWNGSLWVAGGVGVVSSPAAGAVIATSPDGVTWTAQTSPFDGGFGEVLGLAWNGSLWVAVGSSADGAHAVMTSPDGVTWTEQSNPFDGGYGAGVAWNGSLFVAVGSVAGVGQTIMTSPDGSTWTLRTSPFDGGFGQCVAWNGSLWVAGGQDAFPTSSTLIATSPDGVTWTRRTTPWDGLANDPYPNAIAWSSTESQFVAAIFVSGASALAIGTSPDGVTWTERTTDWDGTNGLLGVAVAQDLPTLLDGSLDLDLDLSGDWSFLDGETDLDLDLSGDWSFLDGSLDLDVTLADATPLTTSLESWGADSSQAFNLDVRLAASLSAPPLPLPPPGQDQLLRRISAIYPSPTLDSTGRPVAWEPTSTVDEDWGRYMIVFDGVDVTFFRGLATQLGTMVWNEPFGDDTLDVLFPQITPLEELGTGALSWLVEGVAVEVYHVLPDGSVDYAHPMFEGRWTTEEITLNERRQGTGSGGQQGTEQQSHFLTAHCLGAIYCADLQVKTPAFVTKVATDPTTGNLVAAPQDIGLLISGELNNRSQAGYLQLAPCADATTGVDVSDKGSGTQLVNGYLQDLLAQGSVAPIPTPGSNVVGMAARPDKGGYWLVADDSSVLVFGSRTFYGGSMLGTTLTAPFSAIAATPSGLGYAVVAEDGGVFCFGDMAFQGSLPGSMITPPTPVIGIALTPDAGGYWLVDDQGDVYAFGDATYHGGGPGSSDIVGIAATHGSGYWLVDSTGHVYAYGDAGYHGGASATDIVGIAGTLDDGGYWLAGADGGVFAFGDAAFHGSLPTLSITPAAPVDGIVSAADGSGYWLVAEDGGVFAFNVPFSGSVPGADGEWEAWTLQKDPNRTPVVRLKDRWTAHATMRAGQPGLVLGTLLKDPTTARNVVYGEGTDTQGHTWRNTKYPNLRPVTPPLYPGSPLSLGTVSGAVQTWAQAMFDAGWRINVGTLYDGSCRDACRAFQAANGLVVTGVVGAQTWAATFVTGSNNGDLTASYVAPLAERPYVEPYLYDAFGGIIGPNPVFDPTQLRVEGWETFGTGVDKATAEISALSELMRQGAASYTGTITLYSDPNEMSRYDLRAGMNLLLQGLRGRDVFLHIAQVSLAWNTPKRPVTLTVDERAQDLVTIATLRTADRSTTDPVRRTRHNRRASRIIPDRAAQFDFEAGGGILPAFVLEAGLWSVVRMPAATAGTIVEMDATTSSPATRFALGIFNQPVTPAALAAFMPNPLADAGGGESEWTANEAQLTNMGLVIGWGQIDDACGFSPLQESDTGAVLNGSFSDQGAWQFQSLIPPWLWVACWAEEQCTIQGRLFPQPVDMM